MSVRYVLAPEAAGTAALQYFVIPFAGAGAT
jgi:hypothetical protein